MMPSAPLALMIKEEEWVRVEDEVTGGPEYRKGAKVKGDTGIKGRGRSVDGRELQRRKIRF